MILKSTEDWDERTWAEASRAARDKLSPFIFIDTEIVRYAKTMTEKREFLAKYATRVAFAWVGRYSTDVFLLEHGDALRLVS